MILIGQYDSPFVRRVGVTLTLYGLPFEHRPWSTFSDTALIRPFNPLLRVPVLVLEDGESLIDSHHIIDHLDGLVAPEKRMFPAAGAERRQALKLAALATGVSDKAVALFYEKVLHQQPSPDWVERCTTQIRSSLDVIDAILMARKTAYSLGDEIGHADIAIGCAWRHLNDSHPGLIAEGEYIAIRDLCQRLEEMPVFQDISQAFIPPA